MKNMEKIGIFFSVLLISVTLFFVILTGSPHSQNIPSIPVDQTYPTPSIVPIKVTQTPTTPIITVSSNIPITSLNFDEIVRNSEWKGTSKYGGSYNLRIINGNFNQDRITEHGIRCNQEGKLTLNYDTIKYTFYKNSCNMGIEGMSFVNGLTWLSKDSFIHRWEGEWNPITYVRKYP